MLTKCQRLCFETMLRPFCIRMSMNTFWTPSAPMRPCSASHPRSVEQAALYDPGHPILAP